MTDFDIPASGDRQSVDKTDKAVAEVHRILCPSGQCLFLEHGLNSYPVTLRWQRWLNPLEQRLGDEGIHRRMGADDAQPLRMKADEALESPLVTRRIKDA